MILGIIISFKQVDKSSELPSVTINCSSKSSYPVFPFKDNLSISSLYLSSILDRVSFSRGS
jgi:hypothetical protein